MNDLHNVDDTPSRCSKTSSLGQPKCCPPMDHTNRRTRARPRAPVGAFSAAFKGLSGHDDGREAVFEARSRTFFQSGILRSSLPPTRRLSDRRENIQAEQLARCTRGRSPTRLSRIRECTYGALAPASTSGRAWKIVPDKFAPGLGGPGRCCRCDGYFLVGCFLPCGWGTHATREHTGCGGRRKIRWHP